MGIFNSKWSPSNTLDINELACWNKKFSGESCSDLGASTCQNNGSTDFFSSDFNINTAPLGMLDFGIPNSWITPLSSPNVTSPDGFGGIYTYIQVTSSNEYREYLYQELCNPLTENETYTLKLWVARSGASAFTTPIHIKLVTDISQHCQSAGIAGPALGVSNGQVITFTPTSNPELEESDEWHPLSATFTASASWDGIIIGNLTDDLDPEIVETNPGTEIIPSSGFPTIGAYYLVDEVSLTKGVNTGGDPVVQGDQIICEGENTTIWTPYEGVATYAWNSAPESTLLSTANFVGVEGGTYTVTIAYPGEACPAESPFYTVEERVIPEFEFDVTDASCPLEEDGSVDLTFDPTGQLGVDWTWTWYDENGIQVGSTDAYTVDNLPADTYTVVLDIEDACLVSEEVIIGAPTLQNVNIQGAERSCEANDDYTFSVSGLTGSPTYSWTIPSGATYENGTSSSDASIDISNVSSVTGYSVELTVTFTGGCQVTDVFEVEPCCLVSDGLGGYEPNVEDNTFPFGINPGLPTTGTISEPFSVNGTWVINDDLTLDGCDISLGPDAAIMVTSGNTLTLTGGTHLQACDEMWLTVWVGSGADITVEDGSIIEDAYIGVWLHPNADFTVLDSYFNRNYVGIVTYHRSLGSAGVERIEDNMFLCQTVDNPASNNPSPTYSTLNAPFTGKDGYCGVLMINDDSQTIGKTNAGNHFEHLNYGIKVWEGGELSSINNTFRNMVYDAAIDWSTGSGILMSKGDGLSVTGVNTFEDSRFGISVHGVSGDVDISGTSGIGNKNEFDNLHRGIFINSQNEQIPHKDIDIAYNNMSNVELGIINFSSPNVTIMVEENIIDGAPNANEVSVGIATLEAVALENTDITIRENVISDVSHGVWVGTMDENMMVHDNTITVFETTTQPAFGIIAQDVQNAVIASNQISGTNSNGDDHRNGLQVNMGILDIIGCNTTEDIGNGLHFGGAMAPSWILKNHMEDNIIGLLLNNGVIGNIGLPDVGSGASSWDNTWHGTFADSHTFSQDANANANGYKIYYLNGETTPPYNPSISSSDASTVGWEFHDDEADSGNDVSNIVCPPDVGTQFSVTGNEKSAAILTALEDTSTSRAFYAQVKWSNDLNIYLELLLDSTLRVSETEITSFYDSCHTGNIGKLVRAAQGYVSRKDTTEYLDTLKNISSSVVPEDVWRDVLVIGYERLLDTNAVTDNLAVGLNDLFERVFPDSSFAVAATKHADFTAIQLSTLETIAAQCPYEYGIGVYLARLLLTEEDTVLYTAINDCEKGPQSIGARYANDEELKETVDDVSEFNLYPNPNTGEFNIQLSLEEDEEAMVRFWSINGQLVFSLPLTSGNNSLRLDVANGLYLYRVTVNGQPEWSGKVSVFME